MDDLLLFTPSKQIHMRKLEDLLKALLKNGLKISPRKCQLFKTELQYMGNTIFIKGKRVCVKPLHSWLEVIQELEPPKTVKGCRSFAGMVNFLSIFCQDLQKLLKPIYNLKRKEDHLFGNKSNKLLLRRAKVDYRNHQSYIYQMEKDGFIYIQTQVNMLQEVSYTKYRMVSQN